MIELRVLGTIDLRSPSDGRDCTSILTRPKRLALLAYLAVARHQGLYRRDVLLGIFWPELSQRRARRALSQALYVLRKGLGEGVVVTRGEDEVGIDRSRLWCDAEAFEAALASDDHERALGLYGGDLLEGFSLPGCAEFEQWLFVERERLRGRAVETARALAREEAAAGDPAAAVRRLRRVLAWEPYDEEAVRNLMERLVEIGERPAALHEYRAFEERLMSDLGLELSGETQALAAKIRRTSTTVPNSAEIVIAASRGTVDRQAIGDPNVRDPDRTGKLARLLLPIPVAAALFVTFLVALGTLYMRSGDRTSALDPNRVMIVGFDNRTDQDELDPLGPMATDWLLQELTGTGLVRVVIGTVDGGPVSRGSAISRAGDLGARYAIAGSYDRVRDSIAFRVEIFDVETRESRMGIEGIEGPIGDLPALVERLRQRTAGALATLVDGRLSTVATPGASQPPSFEAYRLYAEGIEWLHREPHRASEALHRAAATDTTFTAPLIWAIAAHRNAAYHPDENRRDERQIEMADSIIQYLERRRDRLPPWDAAALDYKSATLRQDWGGAYAAMQRIVDMSPESEWVKALVGLSLRLNDPHATLAILSELDPDHSWVRDWRGYWTQRMQALHRLGRYEEESETFEEFRKRYAAGDRSGEGTLSRDAAIEIRVLAASGRTDELRRLLDELTAAKAGRPARLWSALREVEIHGHEEIARQAQKRIIKGIAARPREGWDYYWRWTWAMGLLSEGRLQQARNEIEALLEEAPHFSDNRIIHLGDLASIAIALGDSAGARRYDRELEALDVKTSDEPRLSHVIAIQRARIQALLGNRREAIEWVRVALERGHTFRYDHFEHFNVGLERLRGDPAYDELVHPRAEWARR